MGIIKYTPQLKITNLEHLAHGTGAKYLEVIRSHISGEYVAIQWRMKKPTTIETGRLLVKFGR